MAHRRQIPQLVLGMLTALAAVGCDKPVTSSAPTTADIREYVSGAALADLNQSGQFKSAGQKAGEADAIDANVAMEQAVAYARRFGPGLSSYLEEQHGARVDFVGLTAARRVFYGESPYEMAGNTTLHLGVKKRHGSFYFVELRDGDTPVLAVAVSVHNGNITRRPDGSFDFSKLNGNDFFIAGLPLDNSYRLPMAPEAAVELAHKETGKRVTAVPRLLIPGTPESPLSAMWTVDLESAVNASLLGEVTSVQTDAFLVHPRRHLLVRDMGKVLVTAGLTRDLGRREVLRVREGFTVRYNRVGETFR